MVCPTQGAHGRQRPPHDGRLRMKKSMSDRQTPSGIKIGARKRETVLKDFEKVAGPLRGHNRDPKPKA